MSFTESHTVDLSGRLKKMGTGSRRSTAGQTSGGAVMATAVWSSISAGFRCGRSRGEVEEVQGEARGFGVHGIGLRRRGLAGTASDGVQPELSATRARGRRRLEGRRSFPCTREDKGGAQTPKSRRDRRRVDELAGVRRGMGVAAPQYRTEEHSEHSKDFDSILTHV